MTQLREEGWIHHLARHAVACFLTRGDLWQSWEKGAEVFDELLLDADPAINRGTPSQPLSLNASQLSRATDGRPAIAHLSLFYQSCPTPRLAHRSDGIDLIWL